MSYQARALPLAAQRVVNYFAEAQPADAKSDVAVFNAPGTKSFTTGLAGSVRGLEVMKGVLFAVAGDRVYSIASTGVATSLGTIITADGRVSMAVNRASPPELIIIDGVDGWTYDTTNGLVQITDPDFKAATTVTFQDGFFILSEVDGAFFLSGLDNGQSYLATDFANAEGDPDAIVAVFSNHRELWVFGEATIEVYYNAGDLDFPFKRIEGAFVERGCAAAFSIAEDDNTLFWLADDGIVYRAIGYTPNRISTHAIEEAIRKFSTWSDAFGFFVTIAGHKFYHLTFPTGKTTFVYDASTALWHERESFANPYWRASAYANAYNKHIVGDAFEGRLGELDMDTFTEYGGVMQGILTGPPVHSDRKRVFHRRLEIDVESGVGTTTGEPPAQPPPTTSHVLYARFDGVDGATSSVDESTSAHVLTFNDDAQLDSAQKQFGPTSLLLDGAGDIVSIPDSADWHFTGEFTAHGWIRPASGIMAERYGIFGQFQPTGDQRSWSLTLLQPTPVLWAELSTNGTSVSSAFSGGPIEFDVWTHVAMTRDASGDIRLFRNGLQTSATISLPGALFNSSAALGIGSIHGDASGANRFKGHIDQVEIVKGVALWTADFVPPQLVANDYPAMWLDRSDDGGRTYSLRKPPRSMGLIGANRQRLRWNRMGQARNRIYRLTISDPVKRTIIAAHLEAEPGTS